MSSSIKRLLTLDANVLVAALKRDEPYSQKCIDILKKMPDWFLLTEPSIIYQEACGTLARRINLEVAGKAEEFLGKIIHPQLLVNCNKEFCISAYPLCRSFEIYAIDVLYLKVALEREAILVSLDKEDFIDKVKSKNPTLEVYHVSEFQY